MGLKEQIGFSGNFDASWNIWSLPFDQEKGLEFYRIDYD